MDALGALGRFLETPGGAAVGLVVALALFVLAVWLASKLGAR